MNKPTLGKGKAPLHLWAVGVGTLLFNAMGAFSYTMTRLGRLDDLGMTADQIAFLDSFPAWANAVWALGVWGALAGSVLVLLRSRLAVAAMVLATIGLIGTTIFGYAIADTPRTMQSPVLDAAIWAVTLFLLFYARRMVAAGVLR